MVASLLDALMLSVWISLRQRPGPGTVCNVLLIGVELADGELPAINV